MTINEKTATFHNVRFYKPEIRAIHNISFQSNTSRLAVSRSDASLEIWNVLYNPYLQHFFPSCPNSSIEDLKWCDTRLFSCGLQGTVVEYDCFNNCVKYSTSVTGGVAWCLDYCPINNLLAVGTEDGFINIFTVREDELEYFKMLDKQQGRILCMRWDKTGQFLVTGSVDVVRVWNLSSGHAVHKMTTGRSQNKRETIVWSLAVTSDFTIISGDSRGILTFWDGKLGTQVESFRSHEADILSVALTHDENSVVCSGVDPVIAVYGRVLHASSKRQWARGGLYRMHEHDVRAISTAPDGRIFSGGVSGYLTITGSSPKIRLKYPPFLKGECVQAVPEKKQVLFRYLDRIELWQLGEAIPGCETNYSPLPLTHKPACLLRISAESGKAIISASISQNGRYIIYSTHNSLQVFSFNLEEKSVTKLQPPSDCSSSSHLAFYMRDGRHCCVAVTTQNKVYQLDLNENAVDEAHSFLPSTISCVTDAITHLAVSSCGNVMALADCNSHIAVWSTDSWSVISSLPTYSAVPTALAFHQNLSLIVAYSDNKVVEFSLKERKYTEFSKRMGKVLASGVFHSAITGVLFDPRRKDGVLLYDDAVLCTLIRNETIDNGTIAKKKKKNDEETTDENISEYKTLKKFKHIVSASWLDKDEIVLVELTPLAVTESLPPALLQKKFGTK